MSRKAAVAAPFASGGSLFEESELGGGATRAAQAPNRDSWGAKAPQPRGGASRPVPPCPNFSEASTGPVLTPTHRSSDLVPTTQRLPSPSISTIPPIALDMVIHLSHDRLGDRYTGTAVCVGPGGEVVRRTTFSADSEVWAHAGALRRFLDGLGDSLPVIQVLSTSNAFIGQALVNLPAWSRAGLLGLDAESHLSPSARVFWGRLESVLKNLKPYFTNGLAEYRA